MFKSIALGAIALVLSTCINAELLEFDYSGTIQFKGSDASIFGGKAVGDTYFGSFVIDTNAGIIDDQSPFYLAYSGLNTSVTVEDFVYAAISIAVFPDGIEIAFRTNAEQSTFGFLKLNSSNVLYPDLAIPTQYVIDDFDEIANISFEIPHPDLGYLGVNENYGGTIDTGFAPDIVPIPAAAWLFGSGLLGLVGLARRKA